MKNVTTNTASAPHSQETWLPRPNADSRATMTARTNVGTGQSERSSRSARSPSMELEGSFCWATAIRSADCYCTIIGGRGPKEDREEGEQKDARQGWLSPWLNLKCFL